MRVSQLRTEMANALSIVLFRTAMADWALNALYGVDIVALVRKGEWCADTAELLKDFGHELITVLTFKDGGVHEIHDTTVRVGGLIIREVLDCIPSLDRGRAIDYTVFDYLLVAKTLCRAQVRATFKVKLTDAIEFYGGSYEL